MSGHGFSVQPTMLPPKSKKPRPGFAFLAPFLESRHSDKSFLRTNLLLV